eukprot:scaffold1000_cov68-Phaeocystis_antarctica.AAC.4
MRASCWAARVRQGAEQLRMDELAVRVGRTVRAEGLCMYRAKAWQEHASSWSPSSSERARAHPSCRVAAARKR